ncbi:hypothetical protein M3J09_000454 [Ascochyta lentis]
MLKVFLELSEWNPAIRQLVSLAVRRKIVGNHRILHVKWFLTALMGLVET